MKTAQPDGRITQTAEMVVDALRSMAEKLRLSQASPTLQPESDPPDQSSSGAASSSTVQGVCIESGAEPRAGDEFTPDQLPLASSGAVPYSAPEGISTADSTSALPTRSTATSLTSPDEPSYPSRPLSSSSERAERDPTTLV